MCHNDSPVIPVSGGAPLTEAHIDLDTGQGAPLPMFVVAPGTAAGQALPGILLISDIYGPGPFYQDMSRRLAQQGYRVALPNVFHRLEALPEDATRDQNRDRNRNLDQTPALIDIQAALDWLRTQPATGGDPLGAPTAQATGKIGIMGFCMGGTFVMLAGARYPRPDAGVAFYGFPKRERTPLNPILALDEDEIAGMDMPLLGLWGDQDQGVGMDNVSAYDAALARNNKPHEFVVYPGIGHAFMTFDSSAPTFADASDAWNRTLAHFHTHLQHG